MYKAKLDGALLTHELAGCSEIEQLSKSEPSYFQGKIDFFLPEGLYHKSSLDNTGFSVPHQEHGNFFGWRIQPSSATVASLVDGSHLFFSNGLHKPRKGLIRGFPVQRHPRPVVHQIRNRIERILVVYG